MVFGLENLGLGSRDLLGPNTSNLHQRNSTENSGTNKGSTINSRVLNIKQSHTLYHL